MHSILYHMLCVATVLVFGIVVSSSFLLPPNQQRWKEGRSTISTRQNFWKFSNEGEKNPPSLISNKHALDRKSPDVDFSKLDDLTVQSLDGSSIFLTTLFSSPGKVINKVTILVCLSHFGDFNAWEVTQQYLSAIDSGSFWRNWKVIFVGIGSVAAASKFSDDLNLQNYTDKNLVLLADETGIVTETLQCYRGWLAVDKGQRKYWPQAEINPYIKLFGMIFGFGSPGTMERVLYGYTGDKNGGESSRKWVVDALIAGTANGRFPSITKDAFRNVPKECGLRPFELATLRLQTGLHIVRHWKTLGPKDGSLFTQMGGTFVFLGGQCVYKYFDQGILTYAPLQEVLASAAACSDIRKDKIRIPRRLSDEAAKTEKPKEQI